MKMQYSAGGIVFRSQKSEVRSQKFLVLVCQHSQHHGWVFPKGLIDEGESKEEAALREVREETGIHGKIIKSLDPVDYWFVLDNQKIKKTVYYFLMEYVGGDTKDHDHEMENVEWIGVEEVEKRLTYESDKKVWQIAKELIARRK
jgi:8-oxo-dGTP diphosphatase